MDEPTPIQARPKKVLLVLSVLFTALLIVCAVSAYAAYNYGNKAKDARDRQAELEQQIATLRQQAAADAASTSSPTALQDDETADWLTYTNSDYGFSFKYPKDWEAYNGSLTNSYKGGDETAFFVGFQDAEERLRRLCVNAEISEPKYHGSEVSPEQCRPILAKLSEGQRKEYEGPGVAPDVYVRVGRNPKQLPIKDWLIQTYKKANTELEAYEPGDAISLASLPGLVSSTGCCAGVDKAYVVAEGSHTFALGTHGKTTATTSRTDSTMPSYFERVAKTFTLSKQVGITEAKLRNTAYKYEDKSFTLADGLAKLGTGTIDPHLFSFDRMALSDLNGDGREDAATLLTHAHGANLIDPILFTFINDNGTARQTAYITLPNRAQVQGMAVENGVITIDMLTVGPNENYHYPSVKETVKYRLSGGKLVKS